MWLTITSIISCWWTSLLTQNGWLWFIGNCASISTRIASKLLYMLCDSQMIHYQHNKIIFTVVYSVAHELLTCVRQLSFFRILFLARLILQLTNALQPVAWFDAAWPCSPLFKLRWWHQILSESTPADSTKHKRIWLSSVFAIHIGLGLRLRLVIAFMQCGKNRGDPHILLHC